MRSIAVQGTALL